MILPARKDFDMVLEDLNNTYGLNFCHYRTQHNEFDLDEFEKEYSSEKIWVIDHTHEGYFPYESMEKLHKLFDKLKVDRKKIIYVCGDTKIKENYKKWSEKNNFEPINVLGFPQWDSLHWFKWNKNHEKQINKIIYNFNQRDKLFLYANKTMHSFRQRVFNRVKIQGYLDYSYYSAVEYGKTLDEIKIDDEPFYYDNNLYQFYEDSYFEFFVSCDVDERDGRLYMDDKIAKPLIHGHPSISLSNPDTYRILNKMGYEIFEEIFDYSFDSIVDIDERSQVVFNELTRIVELWKKDKKQVHNLFMDSLVREKLRYNQNRFLYHNPTFDILRKELLEVIK